ncbi:hypothetical protein CJ307_21140, partial [Klebsiella quasipneumoniae]
ATEDNTLSIHIDDMLQPWKGDLPGMLDRRTIRGHILNHLSPCHECWSSHASACSPASSIGR